MMCCNQLHGGTWEEVAGVAGELLTRIPTSAARGPDGLLPSCRSTIIRPRFFPLHVSPPPAPFLPVSV